MLKCNFILNVDWGEWLKLVKPEVSKGGERRNEGVGSADEMLDECVGLNVPL